MKPLDLSALARRLGGEYQNGSALVPGPNHGKSDRSLSVKLSSDNVDGFVVHSFSGDDPLLCRDYVRRELGLGEFKPKAKTTQQRITYEYRNPLNGSVAYRKIRIESLKGKTFFFEPKERGGNPPILYGSDRLNGADKGSVVLVVEGEKKVDELKTRGWLAVSADSGARSNWDKIDVSSLDGFKIVIWPDSDDAGEIYASKAAAKIKKELPSTSIHVVRPFQASGERKGQDVCDYRGSDSELSSLINDAPAYLYDAATHAPEPNKNRFKLTALKDFEYNPNSE